jgi:choline kinase
MKTTHAMILAAGYGSRLEPDEGHKILTKVNGTPLFDYHLENFQKLGVSTVTVVTGYENEALEEKLRSWTLPRQIDLNLAYNPDFDSSNGISVLAGVDEAIDSMGPGSALPLWLTMSDHIFAPRIFDKLRSDFHDVTNPDFGGLLGVDRKIDSIFDLPDANKVDFDEDDRKLRGIDKKLDEFNLIDIGLFWAGRGFVDALRQAREEEGDCSTSDAVRQLCTRDHFRFWDIGDHLWQDIDTPEAKGYAEGLVEDGKI